MGGVTVVVPAYNRAGFLPACLGSIRAAGMPCHIVVVDDGSTDDTAAVMATLDGPDVTLVRQANAGLSGARNAGLAQVKTEYVAFLDSDDTWKPGVLGHLVGLLARRPDVAFVFADAAVGNPETGYRSWTEYSGRGEFDRLPFEADGGFRVLAHDDFYRLHLTRNQIFMGASLTRTEAVRSVGRFNPVALSADDYEMTLRLLFRGRFAYLPETMACYTQHPNTLTKDQDGMLRSFVALRRLHRALPRPVTPEVAAYEKELLRHEMFGYAYRAYDRGDYPEARRRLADLGRECGWDARTLAYWLVSTAPAGRGLVQWARGRLKS